MKWMCFMGALLSLFCAACDRTRDLKSSVQLSVTSLGKANETYRELNLYDYEITIENRASFPIFLGCSLPLQLSDYLKVRNPRAICYSTQGEGSARHLSGLDLIGSGGTAELPSGQKLSFVVPLPLEESNALPGRFRLRIYAYVDAQRKKGKPVISEPVAFQP